ncbi:hypothetical protein ACFL6I_01335 [candidate division KSB1 bacterium]
MADNARIKLSCIILILIIIALYGCGDDAIVNHTETEPEETEPGLIFSEVYFYRENPEYNWIEVFNMTDHTMLLTFLRISRISSENVLPQTFFVESGEELVLCADKDHFNMIWPDIIHSVEVNALLSISNNDEGGYICLGTGTSEDSPVDGFRYGDPELSEEQASLYGDQVLEFITTGESWTRDIVNSPDGPVYGAFNKEFPSPGYIPGWWYY